MSDVESSSNVKNPMDSTSSDSSNNNEYRDNINSATVRVLEGIAMIEMNVFFSLYMLDPDLGTMLFWCSISVATCSAVMYYTIQWLLQAPRDEGLYYPCCSRSSTFGLIVLVLVAVCTIVNVNHDLPSPVKILLCLGLPVVLSIPLFIIHTVQYFKSNFDVLQRHRLLPQQGSLSFSNKDTTLLPPSHLVLIRRLDSLLSRILTCLGIIFSLFFVSMIILMGPFFLMPLLFAALAYLLVMFFISHRPRPRQKKKKNKLVIETTAEHASHNQASLLEPLPGQKVDNTQHSESITLLVV